MWFAGGIGEEDAHIARHEDERRLEFGAFRDLSPQEGKCCQI